jgi:predicted ATP-binding protein involved in virulence
LSDLLLYKNGVAIIATHSPVVLQEVPRHCVSIIRRVGDQVKVDRPKIETFGENVGVLTREVFGLEVTNSGYHELLKKSVRDQKSYQEIIEDFKNNLGAEARAILKSLIMDHDLESEQNEEN